MDSTLAVPADVGALCAMAASIGFIHTLLGPDHYVPFVALSHAGRWSLPKTILITLLCGFGHVGSSILLGLGGIALGVLVLRLESIEAVRGDIAGWLLLGFGLLYFVWGMLHAVRKAPHRHLGLTRRGIVVWRHSHQECSNSQHEGAPVPSPVKAAESAQFGRMTPWILAIIFVLGPCEPLIPLLMYPAAKANALAVVCVAALFAIATLVTMTVMVVLMRAGVHALPLNGLHHYAHAACGFALFSCGLAITLGL